MKREKNIKKRFLNDEKLYLNNHFLIKIGLYKLLILSHGVV